jgi:butyrate kinase
MSQTTPLQISQFQSIAATLKPQTVVIAGGDRLEDLTAYLSLINQPFVKRCVLVGCEQSMRYSAQVQGIDLDADAIVGTRSQEETAQRVMEMIADGSAGIVLKGNISTPTINRQILKVKSAPTMSLATVFQAPCISGGRPIILTDPGVSTVLNFSRLSAVIRNSAEVARYALGIERPRVALLSGNEKVIPSLASSVLAADLSAAQWEDMVVYGPLSWDLATEPESVRMKGIKAEDEPELMEVAGQADVIACPNLDSANAIYKVLMSMVGHGIARMAGITVGVKVPYIITSRSDPEQTKLDSVAMSCIYAHRRKVALAQKTGIRMTMKVEPPRHILAVNPGSTSAKIAVFRDDECLKTHEVPHKLTHPLHGEGYDAEVEVYLQKIEAFLRDEQVSLDAVVGRGGFLCRKGIQIEAGVYQVVQVDDTGVKINRDMVSAVRDHAEMEHASNLGIAIAARLAQRLHIPAFTVDPVVCDELCPEAQVSGYAGIERRSVAHVLSLRAMARAAAAEIGRTIDHVSLVLGHLGGGMTIAAFRDGKLVDNTIALLGGGPFTPQRAGSLPLEGIIDLCYSGKFTREGLKKELTKSGGLMSYLGTDDVQAIEAKVKAGDEKAGLILKAMAYQISKEIGAMFIAAGRGVDAIVLSGGIAKSAMVMDLIRSNVGHLAPVMIYRETLEMAAMAGGALRVLRGEEKVKTYHLPTGVGRAEPAAV